MSEPNLLTASGQPCPKLIAAAADLSLFTRYPGLPEFRARKMADEVSVLTGLAEKQAARFGKDATEVAILDLLDLRGDLVYASHLSRDERDAYRAHYDTQIAHHRSIQAGRATIELGQAA